MDKETSQKLEGIVSIGQLTRSPKDDGLDSISQAEYDEKPVPFMVVLPYGFSANAPVNSEVLLLSVGADPTTQAGIPCFNENRFRDLKEWEVKVGNFLKRTHFYFNDAGEIEINVSDDNSTDWAVQFTALKAAYDELQGKFNDIVDVLKTWTVAPNDGGAALRAAVVALVTPESSGDIDASKVEKVRLP